MKAGGNGTSAVHGEEIKRLVAEVSELIRIDGRRALSQARSAQRLARSAGSPELSALAVRSLAHALRHLSRNREALALYNRAGALYLRLGNRVEAARTEIGRIDTLMYLGRHEEALKAAARARRTLARHGERARVMRLDLNTGNIYHRLERHREALRCYDRARRAAGFDSDPLALALIDYNRANALTMLCRHDEAESIYEHVASRLQVEGLHRIEAHVHYNFAYLRFLQGRYDEALGLFESARHRFAAKGEASFVGSCDLDRAEVLLELNQIPEAERLAQAGSRVFDRLHMRSERARALWLQGICAARGGDSLRARRLLDRAQRLFTAEGNWPCVGLTDLARASYHRRTGRLGLARRLARQAAARFESHGLVLKRLQAELVEARALLDGGQLAEAHTAASRARRAGRALPAPWLEFQWHHILARVAEAKGERSRSLPLYRQAIEAIDRVRSGVQVDERKIGLMADKVEVYEDAAQAALAGPRPRFDLAFEFVERSKARALLDALHASLHDLVTTRRRSPRVQRLEREILAIYNLLNVGSRSSERDCGRLSSDLLRRVQRCERELARIEEKRSLAPAQLDSGPPLSQVAEALGKDRTLVEFFAHRGAVSALTISAGGVRHHPHLIQNGELIELLERLRLLIGRSGTLPVHGERQRHLHLAAVADVFARLGEAIQPALPETGNRQELLIVPHGPLHYLPLHACTVDGMPLCSTYSIEYAPSAAVWHTAAAGPATSDAAPSAAGLADGEVVLVGPPDGLLPGAAREIDLLRRLFPHATVLTGSECKLDDVVARLPGARLIHFATHCRFRPDRPELSGLDLGDGWLRVPDLSGLKLKAELVTLSACATGPGQVRVGDEVIGLMRGFLSAGSAKVLASLWPVSDEQTQAFMARFYGELVQVSAPVALQRTMEAMRAEAVHPYVWAPFVMYARRLSESRPDGPGEEAETRHPLAKSAEKC